MRTIFARNVSEAWALFHIHVGAGDLREVRPRGVLTREFRTPVATVYDRPEECVLLDPVRDCNPFFHLYEALWMLAGRDDVARIKYYSPQIAAYSDDATTLHGAYGYRWRQYFEFDQLIELIQLLKRDPDTRRAVLAMWDGGDLQQTDAGRDVPCNATAFFQLREGELSLTVCNRSNDAVWGCYGANAVQFSILLQFMAAAVGARVGRYTQVSNSLHVYCEGKAGEVWSRCAGAPPPLLDSYSPRAVYGVERMRPLALSWEAFLEEAVELTRPPDGTPGAYEYTEPWIAEVAMPMCLAHQLYRATTPQNGLRLLEAARDSFGDDPWFLAGREWLQRRIDARASRGER